MKKQCSLDPLVAYYHENHPLDWDKEFGCHFPLDVEIGSGMGEFLLQRSQNFPNRNIVGIEQIWKRVYKTLKSISHLEKNFSKIQNIKILKVDAFVAFEHLFPVQSIENIFCLFPCPWPKKSHERHRLFSTSFLKNLNRCLQKEGKVQITTDFYPYCEWILEQSQGTGFEVITQNVNPRYNTKFEKKWIKEGQSKFFEISLLKNTEIERLKKEEVVLKTYCLKEFHPDRLDWKDLKGEVSVILKDMLFDPQKKRAMLRVVVSEQNLTQHFWVSIIQKNDGWRICKAEGHNFFSTPGIAKALEHIYEIARG